MIPFCCTYGCQRVDHSTGVEGKAKGPQGAKGAKKAKAFYYFRFLQMTQQFADMQIIAPCGIFVVESIIVVFLSVQAPSFFSAKSPRYCGGPGPGLAYLHLHDKRREPQSHKSDKSHSILDRHPQWTAACSALLFTRR